MVHLNCFNIVYTGTDILLQYLCSIINYKLACRGLAKLQIILTEYIFQRKQGCLTKTASTVATTLIITVTAQA